MSFSSEVKEELSRHLGKSRHCQIAELAALIAFDGKVQVSESGCDLFLDSENELLNTKYDLLLKKLFDFSEEKREKSGRDKGNSQTCVHVRNKRICGSILSCEPAKNRS